jgi:hypothetical protein
VSEGKTPPASQTPRIKDGTFVTPDKLKFPAIPGLHMVKQMNDIRVLKDWIKPDVDMAKPYGARVPQADADGNETSGLRLPDIAVPLATYTGWNLYKAPFPEGELCDRDGSYAPLAATRTEREAKSDPRLSLEERYGNHAAYVKKVEESARNLVAARLLLQEDAERIVERAKSTGVARRFAPASSVAASAMDAHEGNQPAQHDL